MLPLPAMILSLYASFAHVFTKPTWEHAQILLTGAILCPGKRTVTAAMQALGLINERNFSKYHRVLNGAKWDSWQLVKILLGLLIVLVPTNFPIVIAMDETIERRNGKRIKAKGCYRDACRSSKNMVVHCFGLKWQCAALLVKLPWNERYWALPFMTVLCQAKTFDNQETGYQIIVMKKENSPLSVATLGYYKNKLYYCDANNINCQLSDKLHSKLIKNVKDEMSMSRKLTMIRQNIQRLGKKDMRLLTETSGIKRIRHRSSVEYAAIMMWKISRYLKLDCIFVGDGGFASIKLGLACQKRKVALISRLRKDAALYEPVLEGTEKKRGRCPLKGIKAKTLNELIQQSELIWQEHEITCYSGVSKKIAISSGTNLWYTPGQKPLAIRWVLAKDLDTGHIESFFSTDQNLPAVKVVEYFVLRWSVETTFEETRAHLGIETQRQWSDEAINRTTPILMGLFSLVCLMAVRLAKGERIQSLTTAWYDKNNQATFSDVMRFVKHAITREKYINMSWLNNYVVQIPWADIESLLNNGVMAA